MTQIDEGNLRFQFPGEIQASKYDAWSYYNNQFTNVCGGAKAVDIVFKLFPRVIDPATVQQKLKQLLKAIDPHPRVVDSDALGRRADMKWTAEVNYCES